MAKMNDPVGKMLQQLDHEIYRRGTTRNDLCRKAGLHPGAITSWHLVHKRNPTFRGFRTSSWNKLQAVLETLPIQQEELSNITTDVGVVQPADTVRAATFDDTGEARPEPNIKERLAALEQLATAAFSTPLPTVSQPKAVNLAGSGDDALRDLILDHMLVMNTEKLAKLYAYIVNTLKS